MRRKVGFFLASLFASYSFAAAPDIESCSPLAVRPGVPTEITFAGSDLAAAQLWTSFAAQVEPLGKGRFRITAHVPVGVGAVRIFGSNGVSNPTLLMVDDLPSVAESKTNQTRSAAQPIVFASAVDGKCAELSYDWFKLPAKKGQRVSIEIVAARLGSRLDSMLRVVNAAGRELARNDDAPGLNGDSFVSFTASETGDYFIEVRDVNYGGGSEFFYRMRVGDFPLATTAFPAATGREGKQSFQLAGPNGEVGRVSALSPKNSAILPLAVKGRAGSTFAETLVSDGREVIEAEPNNTVALATKVSLSDGINGRFDKANDRDCYEFSARKGERIEFRGATRSLGSPCDLLLQLEATDGKRLARSNPSAADEGVITHTFASNGVYRLIVEESTGAFGANMVYRIVARRAAGFTLSLDTDRVNVAPGKTFELKVTVARGDYKGAVTLALDGFPESFVVTNNVIAEGKSNATMKVTAPESLVPGTWRTFSLNGTARQKGEEIQVRVSTAPVLRRRWPMLRYPPTAFDGVVALGVTVLP